MRFEDPDVALTGHDIARAEDELGLRFPPSLRAHFLSANGGRPDPCVFESDRVDTCVSECIPLKSNRGDDTAVTCYRQLVLSKRLVPQHFFPFANDPGGDVFFVDCSTSDARVYLYRHDTHFEHVIPLGVGLDEFWSRLKPE